MLTSRLLRKDLAPRRYQETIFAQASMKNTLVVLPTGMGKTMIAVMLAAHRLEQYPESRILVVAPTKPLVQQHERTFREALALEGEDIAVFTGSISPEKRAAMWQKARLVCSTPQGLENDLLGSRISLKEVSLLVVDEAHRAVGDYSYVFLAKRYLQQAERHRILALTASPGTDEESIQEVCRNLSIEEIEIRSPDDYDVAPYVQELEVEWVRVQLPPELKEIRTLLDKCLQHRLAQFQEMGIQKPIGKRALLALQGELQGRLAQGDRDPASMKAISLAAEAMKIQHAIEMADTQGTYSLKKYLRSLQEQAMRGQSKAVQNLVQDAIFKTAVIKTESLIDKNVEHPKLRELRRTVLKAVHAQRDIKIIIFTQYRDQGVRILEGMEEINVKAKLFMGQAKKADTGMSQKEQKRILQEFSDGEFPCLIATSVAEEGLDIPKVDLVLFYEPVPSAIRTVQRRGRTGRGEKGRVVVFMTEGTADVGYKWSAHHKEQRMYRAIKEVKRGFGSAPPQKDKTLLQEYRAEKRESSRDALSALKLIVDTREKASPVMKVLSECGATLDLRQLAVGDYQLSDRVVVEYKRIPDFVDSILDGRLLAQLKSLRQYSKPLLLIEGQEDIYAVRRVNAGAIRGMLATITVSYGIPILWSKTPLETAGLLLAIARREQLGGQEFQYHSVKPLSDEEILEYIVAAFPGIGSQLARPLLERFGSIQGIVNATEEELREVSLIGEKKAKRIRELCAMAYARKE